MPRPLVRPKTTTTHSDQAELGDGSGQSEPGALVVRGQGDIGRVLRAPANPATGGKEHVVGRSRRDALHCLGGVGQAVKGYILGIEICYHHGEYNCRKRDVAIFIAKLCCDREKYLHVIFGVCGSLSFCPPELHLDLNHSAMSEEGSLTVAELKSRLSAAGLPVSGKKQDLVTRLLAAAGSQASGSGTECTLIVGFTGVSI